MSASPRSDADTVPSAGLDTLAAKSQKRSRLRNRIEHLCFLLGSALLQLPPRALSEKLGKRLARLYFNVSRSRRRILLENLAGAFPEKSRAEIETIARDCVDNFGATLVDFLETPRLSREEIVRRVTLDGAEHLVEARRRGKGVFLLSAHLGSWEMGALRAGLIDEPISPVVRPLDNPLLEGELARRRTRFGNRTIAKKDAAREILRAIRQKQTVAILVDQNVIAEEAVFVPFFGKLAATTPSLALLQIKTGAAVVPVFTWPLGNGNYRLEFEKPVLAEEFEQLSADRVERVRAATARYMAVTEAAIRRKPSAWFWMHNRWRTRPPE
jgi:Kdo2-lipid IVA lauroyltransferase/acyltransferase